MTKLIARPEARPALESWLDAWGTLSEAAASHPGVETLRGRGRVYVVPRPGGGEAGGPPSDAGRAGARWVVRHYHRGGAVASLLGDRYLRAGTPRPVREFAAGEALAAAGVPTPRVVGAAVYPSGPFYRGDLVTEWVPGSRDLAAVLFPSGAAGPGASGDAAAAMRATGALLRLAHDRGLDHPDLNLKNILIVEGMAGPAAMVLDLDRARVRREGGAPAPVGARRRRGMLDRFWRSARKWEAATGRRIESAARAAFEAGYAEEPAAG